MDDKNIMNKEMLELDSVNHDLKRIEIEIAKLTSEKEILLERKKKLKELILNKKSEKLASRDWSLKSFPWSQKVETLLHEFFKIPDFRPFQLEAINATLSKEDVILIMPTGGGKSLCFQLPALVDGGVTLVVSPLVSLMEDQIMALKKINYPALMLSASSTREDSKLIKSALLDSSSKYKLIYVTPEKLAKSKQFMHQLQKCYQQGRFSRLAIDEVHCCSAWGHDFRPDYNYLGILKDMFPGVPFIGLTATSTSMVTSDVQQMLNIQGCLIIKATFNRPNLYYKVVVKPTSQNEVLDLLENWLTTKFKNESGIIYTTAIKDSEELTKELRKRGIKAGVYHAMLDSEIRSKMHMKWISGEYQVIVATVAFGMGIDKPDVRFVIHHSLSKSMENFYQESGRAGRDGKNSQCIVLFRLADVFKLSTMVFTQQKGLENLYKMVNYCLDSKTCRRSLIAEHFDEVWDSTLCNNMCDHCKKPSKINNIKEINLSLHCRSLYTIINKAMESDVRLTALKLIDAWYGKGEAKLRIPNLKCVLDRNISEKIVGLLLYLGYLKEDFHYTAYSTISYIVKGPKHIYLDDPNHEITLSHWTENSSSIAKKEKYCDVVTVEDDIIEIKNISPKSKESGAKGLKKKSRKKSCSEEELSAKKLKI